MNNYKILIINNGISGGGIERASVSLSNYWAEQGHKITLLTLYQSEHFYSLHKDIKLIEPEFSRKKINKYAYVFQMIIFTRKHIKKVKPNSILAFSEWTNPYVVLANFGLPYPLFLTDRMNPLAKLPFASKMLKKILYKKATGIIAQTNFAKHILKENTNVKNIKVIHNPVNIINKIECNQKNTIISVGRLSPEKGHRFLIEAFAKIKHKNWELSIIGDGCEMSKLNNLASILGVKDRVVFHGYIKDFSPQLSEAKIFVLPSLKEGFPNALLEAMSLPIACIITDLFKNENEIIQDGINGLIVKPACVQELTNAIETLIDDDNLRMKLANNAFRVRLDFKFEKIASQYLHFITQDYVRY